MSERSSLVVSSLILAIGIAICGFGIASGIKYFKNFDRYVEVKGLAEQTVKSNQASLQLGFTASGNNLKQIYQAINDQQTTVVNFLKKEGFKDSEIQKDPVSINDNYANSYNSNAKASRYTANTSVTITSDNVDLVTQTLQQTNSLVEAGVVINNNNLNYMYTDLNSIKAQMLNQALSNAKVAALEFANNSNSTLGKIKYASQGLFTITSIGDNGMQSSSIYKRVRVVTTVQFFLK